MALQLEPWPHMEDKVVIVTGASSGVGPKFCLDLARAGCRIIAAARRVDRLQSLCDEINRSAGSPAQRRAAAVELDVSADGPAIEAAVRRAWDAFVTIHVLVNNAGVTGRAISLLDLLDLEWNRIIKTNLMGSWLVSKYVCTCMCASSKGGSVINISSITALNRGSTPGIVAYAASKVAVNAMTKVMAIELGAHSIRVNTICPGIFKSEITEALVQKDWFRTVVVRTIPLRTSGTTDRALTSLRHT